VYICRMAKMLKCPSCDQWNTVAEGSSTCTHCHKPFHIPTEAEHRSLERRKEMGDIKIPIHPHDSWPMVMLKTVFNWVQVVFLAIISFILWFVAAGPG